MKRARVAAHHARKRFGQHFLEAVWAEKVLEAIAPGAGDTFLEIGPGLGALTSPLAARVKRVVAFEIDRDLARTLKATAPHNLLVIEGDFMDATAERVRAMAHGAREIRVAGNLPYNVASRMLFKLAELFAAGLPAADATLMLQREVADRLTALPGTRDYGILTVLMGRRAVVEQILTLPPGAFRPVPNVRSALVRLTFRRPHPEAKDEHLFEALVKSVFGQRRKTLKNALQSFDAAREIAAEAALAIAELDGRRRPETLSAEELVRLADVFSRVLSRRASRPSA